MRRHSSSRVLYSSGNCPSLPALDPGILASPLGREATREQLIVITSHLTVVKTTLGLSLLCFPSTKPTRPCPLSGPPAGTGSGQ